MCLAIPGRIEALHDHDMATVDVGGTRKQISLALIDGAEVGDYVIVHVGYALSRLLPDEAEKTLALFAEMAALAEQGAAPDRGSTR